VIVGKILEKDQYAYGFDSQTGEYVNLISKGIIDPTKVVRVAIQNAASIAALLISLCLAPHLGGSFLLAQVPGDFFQILGFASAKQPTEFVEIQRSSISYGPGRLPRPQGPRRPKPSYQAAKEHRGITAG